MKAIRLITSLLVLLLVSANIYAQIPKVKKGKLKPAYFNIPAEIDQDASAVILYDKKTVEFHALRGSIGQKITRHKRILIRTKDAFYRANLTIPLHYYGDGNHDRLTRFVAFTHKLENGKVVSEKTKRKAGVVEVFNETLTNIKFSLPNITEGVIVEFVYSVVRPYLHVSTWYFQHNVPCLWSQYNIKIPEFLTYQKNIKGYLPLVVSTNDAREEAFTFSNSGSGRTGAGNANILQTQYVFAMRDIAAFGKEPHVDASRNYMAGISHELLKLHFTGRMPSYYTKDWAQIDKALIGSSNFGKRLKSSSAIKELAAKIKLIATTDEQKIYAAHTAVRKHMVWNGSTGYYPDASIKKMFKEGSASAAGINFVLVQLLRELDIMAYPVVMSTRRNGRIHPARASRSQLNYTVAAVKIGNGYMTLDASDKNLSPGLLPVRAINGSGRIIGRQATSINLSAGGVAKSSKRFMLTLSDDGIFTGKASFVFSDYSAYLFRKWYSDVENDEDFVKQYETQYPGMQIDNFEIANLDSLHKPIKLTLEVKFENKVDKMGYLLNFSPMLIDKTNNNPFKVDKRKYPVDFAYSREHSVNIIVKLPESYNIESLPKSTAGQLQDKHIQFSYRVSGQGKMISLNHMLQINNTRLVASDYQNLKQLYDMIVSKHAEPIVLKKVAK